MRVDLRVKHDIEARKAAIGLFAPRIYERRYLMRMGATPYSHPGWRKLHAR